MKSRIVGTLLFCSSAVAAFADAPAAKPFVCPLFSDNMVLQRDQKDPVWGWSKPGDRVTVAMSGQSASAIADANGKWMALIQPPATGGPYEMDITGPQEAHLKNVMVGDVWICSGQSNMTLGVKLVNNSQAEIASADHPDLRFYDKENDLEMDPSDQTKSNWRVCSPAVIGDSGMGFTAAGYFFGRDLQSNLKIPVGLIHTSWGGTPIEGWISRSALTKATPDFNATVEHMNDVLQQMKAGTYDFDKLNQDWYRAAGAGIEMAAPGFDDSAWKTVNLPASLDAGASNKMPEGNGVFFLRKTFDLPAEDVGKSSRVNIDFIKYIDQVSVNGVDVGNGAGNGSRNYWVRPGILKAGKNVIAVRTFDRGGPAGIYGAADKLALVFDGGGPTIALAGDWKYNIGPSLAGAPDFPSQVVGNSQLPNELFNGMIAPLIPFGVKGVIWYQGESNVSRAYQYRTLLPTMINDWRTRWHQPDLPFFIVQLANFTDPQKDPGDSDWAELREAQFLTTQKVPHTGIATAIDIGNPGDIHPKNKQEIGRRLSLAARALVYGEKIEYSGPVYQSMQVEGSGIRIKFTHADGLISHAIPPLDPTSAPAGSVGAAAPLLGFAVAGSDHKFYWADAKIDGEDIVVSSAQVSSPEAVRYDWGNDPPGTLYNSADLPALPFRTDDWPLTTLAHK